MSFDYASFFKQQAEQNAGMIGATPALIEDIERGECEHVHPRRLNEPACNAIAAAVRIGAAVEGSRLRVINLHKAPDFGSEQAATLVQGLFGEADGRSLGNVEHLVITQCGLGDAGFAAVARAVRFSTSLTHVDLRSNKHVMQRAFLEWGEALEQNTSLEELYLCKKIRSELPDSGEAWPALTEHVQRFFAAAARHERLNTLFVDMDCVARLGEDAGASLLIYIFEQFAGEPTMQLLKLVEAGGDSMWGWITETVRSTFSVQSVCNSALWPDVLAALDANRSFLSPPFSRSRIGAASAQRNRDSLAEAIIYHSTTNLSADTIGIILSYVVIDWSLDKAEFE